MSELNAPVISVDRAVGHYVESLDIVNSALASYYSELPDAHKRPLDECRIHFSALGVKTGDHTVGMAVSLADRNDTAGLDPQAPPSDIIVFVGSMVARNKLHATVLSQSIKHELRHFTQDNGHPDESLTDREKELKVELAMNRGRLRKALFLGKAAVFGTIYEGVTQLAGSPASVELAAGYGLGLAVLTSIINRKTRRTRIKELEYELHQHYKSKEFEMDANKAADTRHSIVKVTRRQYQGERPSVLFRNITKRRNRVIDFAHRQMSTISPRLNYP